MLTIARTHHTAERPVETAGMVIPVEWLSYPDITTWPPTSFSRAGSDHTASGQTLATAAVRVEASSLANAFSRCLRTVPGDKPSWRAIAVLSWPAATRRSSSRWRPVSNRSASRRLWLRRASAMCG